MIRRHLEVDMFAHDGLRGCHSAWVCAWLGEMSGGRRLSCRQRPSPWRSCEEQMVTTHGTLLYCYSRTGRSYIMNMTIVMAIGFCQLSIAPSPLPIPTRKRWSVAGG